MQWLVYPKRQFSTSHIKSITMYGNCRAHLEDSLSQTQCCKFFCQSKCFKQHLSHNFSVLQERVKGIKISQALSELPYKYTRGTESTNTQELLTRVFWVLASIGSFLWSLSTLNTENSEKWSKKFWKISTQKENFKYQRTFNGILTGKANTFLSRIRNKALSR